MAVGPPSRTEELNGAPLADVIHAVAMAVADGQFHMDQASLRAAEFMIDASEAGSSQRSPSGAAALTSS